MKTLLSPTQIEPRPKLVMVKAYEKPEETPGGIVIPEEARTDRSWTTWEVVKAGAKVGEILGADLAEGDIVRTPPEPPVDAGVLDPEDLRPLFFLDAERIVKVIRWR